MVFPPVPVYLDPHPPSWQQQQGGAGCSSNTTNSIVSHHQLSSMMMPPPPAPSSMEGGSGGGGTGSVRPGSMAERARLAKIPQPETALKCPRCESTNTKFCYFNNYSLTQPRHFCKNCRRYWTRGGALRNVPVGGGCRRNKRSKRSRSKSPPITSTSDHRSASASTTTTALSSSNGCAATDLLGHNLPAPQQLPFFAPLDNLSIHHDFGNADIGLNFCGIHEPPLAAAATTRGTGGNEIHEFQIAGGRGGSPLLNLSARFADQWKLNHQVQQFPNFMSGAYGGQFEGEVIHEPALGNYLGNLESNKSSSSALEVEASHLASVLKLQESNNNHQETDLSRNFSESQDQYWTGINTWTDLSAPSTSTAGHHLM